MSKVNEIKMVEKLESSIEGWCQQYASKYANSEFEDIQIIYDQIAIHFAEVFMKAEKELENEAYQRFCLVFYINFMIYMTKSIQAQMSSLTDRYNHLLANRLELDREIDEIYEQVMETNQAFTITSIKGTSSNPKLIRSEAHF